MATKLQIKTEAARMLGIIKGNQPLAGVKSETLDEYYQNTYDELKHDALAIYSSTGAVPDRLAPHIAAKIAMQGTENFDVSEGRYNRIVAKNNIAFREIQKFASQGHDYASDYENF